MFTSSLCTVLSSILILHVAAAANANNNNNNVMELSLPTNLGQMTKLQNLTVHNNDNNDNNNDSDTTSTIIILPLSSQGQLVTLTRTRTPTTNNNGTNYRIVHEPIGRSYHGYDWERVAGPAIESSSMSLEYTCYNDNATTTSIRKCQTTLDLSSISTSTRTSIQYYLTVYEYSLSTKNEIARFLERATFGPTTSELSLALSTINTTNQTNTTNPLSLWQATYIQHQLTNTPVSSHREYYRQHLHPTSIEVYAYGGPARHACDAYSQWRTFAFTRKDYFLSKYSGIPLQITPQVSNKNNDETVGYILSFQNHIRTILTEPLHYTTDDKSDSLTVEGTLTEPGEYPICKAFEFVGNGGHYDENDVVLGTTTSDNGDTQYPRSFGLFINGICRDILGGNPKVQLDPRFINFDTDIPYHLNFSTLDTTNNTTTATTTEWMIPMGGGNNTSTTIPSMMLLTKDGSTAIHQSNPQQDVCSNIPHPLVDNSYVSEARLTRPKPPVFATLPNNQGYAIHDYHLELMDNTIHHPNLDGNGNNVILASSTTDDDTENPTVVMRCINADQNIFNQDSCQLSYDANACGSLTSSTDNNALDIVLTLDNSTLWNIQNMTQRHVYAMEGIQLKSSSHSTDNYHDDYPCQYRQRSRWIPVQSDECNDSTSSSSSSWIDNVTHSEFATFLYNSNDNNPYLKDIIFRGTCHSNDTYKTGMYVYVSQYEQCYQHVHSHHLSIYDVTSWKAIQEEQAPLSSTTILNYSSFENQTYTVDWFEQHHTDPTMFGTYIGRYGDEIKYHDLPQDIQSNITSSQALSELQGSIKFSSTITNQHGGTVVCGSPNEVSPSITREQDVSSNQDNDESSSFDIKNKIFDSSPGFSEQRQTVWTNLALEAPDQLRQRMAFALSQIMPIDPTISDRLATESNLVYYDILVRNALGNYGDVLREMVYNARMGETLTYVGSKSVSFYWNIRQTIQYPDENFAREFLQLFTIGLEKLNPDGTKVLDKDGDVVPTHEPSDIVSFARAWTGFRYAPMRGNSEDIPGAGEGHIDPMRIENVAHRDWWPKRGLEGKYVGDRYPLCIDLPERAFLKKGAKYRLLGGSSNPKWQSDEDAWKGDDTVKRFVLKQSSALYSKLCNASTNQDGRITCSFPGTVTLDENLHCEVGTVECEVDVVRVVQVAPGVFYEYLRVPCVQLVYYNDAKNLAAGSSPRVKMCGNPRMPIATEACCGLNGRPGLDGHTHSYIADRPCAYKGERITYNSNAKRCADLGGYHCDFINYEDDVFCDKDCCDHCGHSTKYPESNIWSWTTASCSLQMLVDSKGQVATVHDPDQTNGIDTDTAPHVDVDKTISFYNIHWETDTCTGEAAYPSVDNGCGSGACKLIEQLGDQKCLCDTTVSETVVFSSMPSKEEVLSQLHIGAFDPDMFDGDQNKYTLVGDTDGVQVYQRGGISSIAADHKLPHRCESSNYIHFNADAERGTTEDWSGYGNAIGIVSPGYDGSKYAFKASINAGDTQYWKRGLMLKVFPTECVEPFQTFHAEFQVQLRNESDESGVLCDATSSCPRLYIAVRSENGNFDQFEVQGLDSWNPNNWNKFSSKFSLENISEDWFPLQDIKVVVRRGDATDSSNVVMLVDDIVISPVVTDASKDVDVCRPLTQVVKEDFQKDSFLTNGNWIIGRRGKVRFEVPGYNESSGALATYDMVSISSGPIYRNLPASYISPSNVLTFEYKIKVYSETGGSVPDCSDNLGNCPYILLNVMNDTERIRPILNGISEWNTGEWNSFRANFTVPLDWTDITTVSVYFTINRLWLDHIVMIIDDFHICEVPPEVPTTSPSASPSLYPSDTPSIFPSYSPSAYSDFTTETIFKVENEHGKSVYLKNIASTVQLGGMYTIRNPPNFIDTVDPALRDAYFETDAVIDHFLHNSNTAPFVSKLLIQHFGISNPSPRYVETVANAFRMGSYEWSDGSSTIHYGDGRSGSLSATAAAIMLDREATTVTLDADPTYGSLRQPLIKVVGFMRSMDYQRSEYSKLAYPLFQPGLRSDIGQMVYESPDVFSFFSPRYGPGSFQRASLVSPESQILTTVTTVRITNGLFSLIANGMSPCYYGFGSAPWPSQQTKHCKYPHGKLSLISGLDPSSAEEAVSQLATLITSGRLSQASHDLIVEQYNTTFYSENAETALKTALHLLIVSPEFHSTNPVRPSGLPRLPRPQPGTVDEPYKAIVYVYLFGGMDSFYMLAPHSTCDVYHDYELSRGDTAKLDPERMLSLDASTSNQPCSKFGLHDKLPVLKTLYDTNEAIFFANMGHLAKFVTKDNFVTETKTQLFSHSTMMQEVAKVDAMKDIPGTGVLGRMLDVLQSKNYSVNAIGIDLGHTVLDGDIQSLRQVQVIPNVGLPLFYPISPSNELTREDMTSHIRALNGESELNSGMYGNLWSQELVNAMNETSKIRSALDSVATTEDFASGFGRQLAMVAKLIKARSVRNVNRDAFFIRQNGFDTHANMKAILDERFVTLNDGIDKFQKEMKLEGIFNNITFVLASEFGRTISPNSGEGTDHGWGGNTFVIGGGIKGGRILGKYPESFSANDPTNDGRGRLIPTTSWDAIWNGIANWFGITEEEDLNQALPNRDNFGCNLFTSEDLYKDENQRLPGCGGDSYTYVRRILSSERVIMTGPQQKLWCKAIVKAVEDSASNETVRCFVKSQYTTDCDTRRLSIFDASNSDTSSSSETVVEMMIESDGLGTHNELDDTLNSPINKDQLSTTLEEVNPSISIAMSDALRITDSPSMVPSSLPSSSPSSTPTAQPSLAPSDAPSVSASPSQVPSLSPSDAPSLSPSDQPSSTPSISAAPSSVPSEGPSYQPDFNWDIFPLNVTRATFSDEHMSQEIVLSFKISNQAYTLKLYQSDCKTPVNKNILDWTVSSPTSSDQLPSDTKEKYIILDLNINVDIKQIQDETNGVWSSSSSSKNDQSATAGIISVCTVLNLYWDKEEMFQPISFLQNRVDLTVDLAKEFIFTDIATSKTDAADVNSAVDGNYQVTAYQCDAQQNQVSSSSSTSALSQGDDIYVCVESTSPDVVPVGVQSFDLVQDGENGGSLSVVAMSKEANTFSKVTCGGGSGPTKKCMIHTKAISAFFHRSNSNSIITGSGIVILGFDGNGEDSSSRKLTTTTTTATAVAVYSKTGQERSLQSSSTTMATTNMNEKPSETSTSFRVALQVKHKKDDIATSEDRTSKKDTMFFVSIGLAAMTVLGMCLFLVIKKYRRRDLTKVAANDNDQDLQDEKKKTTTVTDLDDDDGDDDDDDTRESSSTIADYDIYNHDSNTDENNEEDSTTEATTAGTFQPMSRRRSMDSFVGQPPSIPRRHSMTSCLTQQDYYQQSPHAPILPTHQNSTGDIEQLSMNHDKKKVKFHRRLTSPY